MNCIDPLIHTTITPAMAGYRNHPLLLGHGWAAIPAWSRYSPTAPYAIALVDREDAFGDERLVPHCAVLFWQRDELPVSAASTPRQRSTTGGST